MLNDLLLLSGNDIPFEKARTVIHQPTIKEIAYIGEECFFAGCDFLKFSKNKLSEQDKVHLEHMTNFDIIMSIMMAKEVEVQKSKVQAFMVLSLLFPRYSINLEQRAIAFQDEENINNFKIDNENFENFKEILDEMFCLKLDGADGGAYNAQDPLSKKIAEKFERRRQMLSEKKDAQQQSNKVAILSRYVSILAVGQKKDINQLLNYTVYQLFDEFNRFELKSSYDIYLQAKMAGAQDLKEVEDWMKDIH